MHTLVESQVKTYFIAVSNTSLQTEITQLLHFYI